MKKAFINYNGPEGTTSEEEKGEDTEGRPPGTHR